MSKITKSDIYQALFPIYHLSKASGLLPVRFVRQRNDQYLGRVYLIDIIYGAFLIVLFILLEVWGLWRDLRDGWEHSTRLKNATAVNITIGDVCAVALLASAGVLGAPFRWKFFQEMISRFVHADDRLGFTNLKKTRRFAIILATATVISFIILASLDIYVWDEQTKKKRKMSDKGPINYSPIYFLYLQALIIEIQYTIATYNLNERFLRLNKNLENLLKSAKNLSRRDISFLTEPLPDIEKIPVTIVRPELPKQSAKRVFRTPKKPEWAHERDAADIADALSQLIGIHSSLCDINLLINKAFGFPILVVGITCLVHLIITPYFLMMEANSDKEAFFIVIQCLWCVLHIYRMLVVVQPCYAATKESKITAIFISQLLACTWQPDIRKQLEIFSLQILHRPLVFSACGLFSLDRALVTSMAGAVTTYLVILIQFQKADDTKNDTNNMIRNATSFFYKNVSSFHNITGVKPA